MTKCQNILTPGQIVTFWEHAKGGVPNGRPPLPQEDRQEPAGQHGVRTAGPP